MTITVDAPASSRWWPVATRAELNAADGFLAVRLLDEPWLLVRLDGAVSAVRDQCPHRRVPLSAGRRVATNGGERLECRYHGWQFETSGACALIPALGADSVVPPKMRVATAALVEDRGLLWLAPGGAAGTVGTVGTAGSPPIAELRAAEPGDPIRVALSAAAALDRLSATVGGVLAADRSSLRVEFPAADGSADRLTVLAQPEAEHSVRLFALWHSETSPAYSAARSQYWTAIARRSCGDGVPV